MAATTLLIFLYIVARALPALAGGCAEGTACWRRPWGCSAAADDCSYAAEWSVDRARNKIYLTVSGRSNGWVAVGFSSDQAMAGDDVLMCIAEPDGAGAPGARFEHRYNYGYSNVAAELEGITVDSASFTDGILNCSVTRDITVFNSSDMTFDLSSDWFMFFGYGPISSSGLPVRHSKNPAITEKRVSLSSFDDVIVLGESRRPSPSRDETKDTTEGVEKDHNRGARLHPIGLLATLGVGILFTTH